MRSLWKVINNNSINIVIMYNMVKNVKMYKINTLDTFFLSKTIVVQVTY